MKVWLDLMVLWTFLALGYLYYAVIQNWHIIHVTRRKEPLLKFIALMSPQCPNLGSLELTIAQLSIFCLISC